MRLAHVGRPGGEIPAVWEGAVWRDASSVAQAFDGQVLAAGLTDIRSAVVTGTLPLIESPTRFGPRCRASARVIRDQQSLGLRLWVNGELRQDGTTQDMIFPVDYLVWCRSQCRTCRAGDVVEVEIDGLGRQRQVFEAA